MNRLVQIGVPFLGLALLLAVLSLTACGGGDTSSGQCQTFTDANNNPVTQCSQ